MHFMDHFYHVYCIDMVVVEGYDWCNTPYNGTFTISGENAEHAYFTLSCHDNRERNVWYKVQDLSLNIDMSRSMLEMWTLCTITWSLCTIPGQCG